MSSLSYISISLPPPQSSLLLRHRSSPPPARPASLTTLPRRPNARSASSPQPPNPVVTPEEDSPPLEAAVQGELQFRGCKTCGREEIEKGCNGEGRIQGGIATVPGFGWWPIKAFRPCPGFVASGGRYRRRGQSMDEVASGTGKRDSSMGSTVLTKSSKRGQDPNKL